MIPEDLLKQGVMLAEPSKVIHPEVSKALSTLMLPGTEFYFDVKWDGVRCLAYLDDGKVLLRNRNGVDITSRYPDVASTLLDTYGTENRVFDGEIIARGKDGRPDFNRLARRDRQTSPEGVKKMLASHPVIYVAFDLLWMNGADLRTSGTTGRISVLKEEPTIYEWDPKRLWVSPSSTDGEQMWTIIQQHQLEGLIAKASLKPYRAGRQRDWIKLKVTHTASCVVTGVQEGTGKRKGKIGALLLGVYRDGELIEVGKAGTGFTEAELARLAPLVSNGTPLVVEVEYANLTKDGRLRFPSYKGTRSDVPPTDCTYDQLETA
jgi:bifunctional non-homologous end joining protein LigD